MGCRNHSVYPIAMQGYETMAPLEPPNFDAVTSLALLQDGTMVSGSRDKNLRMWDTLSNSPLQG
jgi:WD40 repeat protein